EPGRAAPDDDHRLRRSDRSRLRRLLLSQHEQLLSAPLDVEARNGRECGAGDRLAAAEIEARVVPWTTNRFADDDALVERTTVMRARRAHGVKPFAAPH